MGQLAEQRLVPLVESPRYRSASDAKKGELLRLGLTGARVAAKSRARQEKPALFQELTAESLLRRERLFLRERAGGMRNDRIRERLGR